MCTARQAGRQVPHSNSSWYPIQKKNFGGAYVLRKLYFMCTLLHMIWNVLKEKELAFLFLVINFYSCWTELCNLSIFGQIPVGVLESTLPPIYFVFLNLIWNSYFNFLQGRVFCTPTNFVINCDTHLTSIKLHSITILFKFLIESLVNIGKYLMLDWMSWFWIRRNLTATKRLDL